MRKVNCSPRQHRRSSRWSTSSLIEALDRRVLLSVAFKFNIVDPTNQFKSIRPQLQTLLNAAGGEWAPHPTPIQERVRRLPEALLFAAGYYASRVPALNELLRRLD